MWGLELALYTALAFWRPSWRDLVIGPGILLLHPVEALELNKLPWILSATAVLAGIHRGTQSVAFIPSQPTEVTRKRKCCASLKKNSGSCRINWMTLRLSSVKQIVHLVQLALRNEQDDKGLKLLRKNSTGSKAN